MSTAVLHEHLTTTLGRMPGEDPRWPPGRRRTAVVILTLLTIYPCTAICPSRCICNDKLLEAHCRHTNLEVVPIQLNPDVRILSLTHNRIANIHLTFSFYISLSDLNLAHNKIKNLGARNFEFQYNLIRLNLSDNSIQELHKDAFKGLKNLTVLDLSGNSLEEVTEPLAFQDLRTLHVLDLSRNKILLLGVGAFDYLLNLRRLLLKSNQLSSVPESSINTLDRLEELDLDLNLIKDVLLPRNMDTLRVLRLRSNVISTLTNESLQYSISLQNLDLSDNNITTVPTSQMSNLSNLLILNLSSNLFEFIGPHAFRHLYKLTEIYTDDILTLSRVDSKAFAENPHLKVVSLTRNPQLRYLPKHFLSHKPHLRHVYLSENAFSTLDASDLPLDQLETLRLGGNPFKCNCSLLWLWILKERQTVNNCSEPCPEPRALKQTAEEYSDEEHLVEDSAMYKSFVHTNHIFYPVISDLDQISCESEKGPVSLWKTPKSEFDCSATWVLILSVSTLVVLFSFLIAITAYMIRLRLRRKSRNPVDNFLTATKTYEDTHHTYYRYGNEKSVADPFAVNCVSNMYMKPNEPFDSFKHHTGSLRPPGYCNGSDGSRKYASEANIYQEPFAGPVLTCSQRPHIVYV